MKNCYYCKSELSDNNDHKEHIIPNGIGGKLKCKGILCEKCGGILGESIDQHFCKNFEDFNNLIEIKKDRVTSSKAKKYDAEIDGLKIVASLKDSVLIPDNFLYDEASNKVYANPKIAKNLKNKYPDAHFITEMAPTAISYKPDINISLVSKGLVKIATEYALSCGLDITVLNKVFNYDSNEFIIRDNIIPYFPVSYFEGFIESVRWFIEKEYPTHSLKLFSINNLVFCYIDLFSVYQYYVLISDSYKGVKISNWHIESVSKIQPIYKKYDLSLQDPKDIHIASGDLGLSIDQIMSELKKGKTIFEKNIIPPYKKIEPLSYFTNVAMDILQQLNMYLAMERSQNKEILSRHISVEILDRFNCFPEDDPDNRFKLFIDARFLAYQVDDEDYFDMFKYKSLFIVNNQIGIVPLHILENIQSYKDKIDSYQNTRYRDLIGLSKIWEL